MNNEAKDWPFEGATNVAVFSILQFFFQHQLILHVTHDEDDGSWQIFGKETSSTNDIVIMSLEEIVELDTSVKKLSDLPFGWEAWRTNKGGQWGKTQRAA